MLIDELTGTVKDTLTVSRVYGEAYERDGVTVVPVASIGGGGGGGGGQDQGGRDGQGGGFGLAAKPAGVYVIADGRVSWKPAVDVNRVVAAGAAVAIAVAIAAVRITDRSHPDR